MDLPVNGARGEVALRVGTVDLVIAAEMERLSAVSTALECKSLADLFTRVSNVEVAAAMAGIRHLTVRGDSAAALKALRLKHFPTCATAFGAALAHHFAEDEPGNGNAARG